MNRKLENFLKTMDLKNGNLYHFEKMASCLLGKHIKVWEEDGILYVEIIRNINKKNILLEFGTISSCVEFISRNIPDDYTNRLDLFSIL